MYQCCKFGENPSNTFLKDIVLTMLQDVRTHTMHREMDGQTQQTDYDSSHKRRGGDITIGPSISQFSYQQLY